MSGPAVCGLFGGALSLLGWLAFGLVFALLGALAYAFLSRLAGGRRAGGTSGDGRPPAAGQEPGRV